MTIAITKTHAAIRTFNQMDFCGMTPREIAAWYRTNICPAHRAIEDMQREHNELFAGRFGHTPALRHQKVIDGLQYSLSLLMVRRDREIELALLRSHNRRAAA